VEREQLGPFDAQVSYAGMNLMYEMADTHGGWPIETAAWQSLDGSGKWQTVTRHITDASFSKMWVYAFAFAIGKSDPFVIGKIEVSTKPFAG
jgi:polysaccharide biosynthesis protein PslG